jgi:hypothetical protein
MAEIWYLVTSIILWVAFLDPSDSYFLFADFVDCELMLTYDTPALRQTGSRNLTGPKTIPTIWGTYMKLVTKYQISAINSCWEKCDEKWAYMFNVYFLHDVFDHITGHIWIWLLYPRSPKGKGGILFYLCPSVRPRYFSSHFSQ